MTVVPSYWFPPKIREAPIMPILREIAFGALALLILSNVVRHTGGFERVALIVAIAGFVGLHVLRRLK